MNPIISIKNISKQYRLGVVGSKTLTADVQRFWARVRGKEDPFLKIGETNVRSSKGASDYVWALKDISFDVMPGEVLGIIGKNGAGKSTLLKILSRVTGPTTGRIDFNGRIGSLLEVGTGFHPELTGRENIFLNGAILGMTKAEIRAKLDEIVDFAGVERYIDTPVKRYSSGMMVRLGFAVAAHLEPEILVVDEVLAVGDADFQKKAIGKMQDVSKDQGRTVIFVSHNMAAIETLCSTSIFLKDGMLVNKGISSEIISQYLSTESNEVRKINCAELAQYENENIKLLYASAENASKPDEMAILDVTSDITFRFGYMNKTDEEKISIAYDLHTIKGDLVFGSKCVIQSSPFEETEAVCKLPGNLLNDNIYSINVYFHTAAMRGLFIKKQVLTFEVKDVERSSGYLGKIHGFFRLDLDWEKVK